MSEQSACPTLDLTKTIGELVSADPTLTENLTDINPRLSASPSTVKVAIPYPNEQVRAQFLEFLASREMLIL